MLHNLCISVSLNLQYYIYICSIYTCIEICSQCVPFCTAYSIKCYSVFFSLHFTSIPVHYYEFLKYLFLKCTFIMIYICLLYSVILILLIFLTLFGLWIGTFSIIFLYCLSLCLIFFSDYPSDYNMNPWFNKLDY